MNYYGHSKEIPETDERQTLWASQRAERGFDDTELWNLDSTIAKFILPRLVAFKPTTCIDEGVMDKMIYSFLFLSSEEKYNELGTENWNKVDIGLQLFAVHFGSLWN